MFAASTLFLALAKFVELANALLTVYKYILFAAIILSWFSPDRSNPVVRFLNQATEPVLRRARRFTPDTGMIDLSPLLVFGAIMVLQIVVCDSAYSYLMLLGAGAN